MTVNEFLGYGILALLVHTSVYLVGLRQVLRSEFAIFAYHLFPSLLLFALAVAFAMSDLSDDRIAAAVALTALNGIYSLTFLELWTLSQISYSREVLVKAQAGNLHSASSHADHLWRLGDEKRTARLESLRGMGLLASTPDGWKLGRRGRALSAFLQFLLWLPNLRSRG